MRPIGGPPGAEPSGYVAGLHAGRAYAASPLAQYGQLPGDPGYSLSFANGTLSTPTGGYETQFSFMNSSLPGGNLDADFHFTATQSGGAYQTTFMGNTYDVLPVSGNFSFVYDGSTPLVVDGKSYGAGTTLLAGTFSGASLNGVDTGSTGSLTNSRLEGGNLNFTSGISAIQFGSTRDEGMSLALNSVTPFFGISGSTLAPFMATSTGTFAADVTIGGGGVPEVGAWITMILGFGLAGATIRVRNARLLKA